MASRRQERVAELLHHEISNLLTFQIQDPRIGFATVTEVTISPDLKNARIFVSVLSDDEKETLAGLESAVPFMRRELAKKLELRYTPQLKFEIDRSTAYAAKIETLMNSIEIPPESDDDQLEDDIP